MSAYVFRIAAGLALACTLCSGARAQMPVTRAPTTAPTTSAQPVPVTPTPTLPLPSPITPAQPAPSIYSPPVTVTFAPGGDPAPPPWTVGANVATNIPPDVVNPPKPVAGQPQPFWIRRYSDGMSAALQQAAAANAAMSTVTMTYFSNGKAGYQAILTDARVTGFQTYRDAQGSPCDRVTLTYIWYRAVKLK